MKDYIVFCGDIRNQMFVKTQRRNQSWAMTRNVQKAKKMTKENAQKCASDMAFVGRHFLPSYKLHPNNTAPQP